MYYISSRRQSRRGGSPASGLGKVLIASHRRHLTLLRNLGLFLVLTDQNPIHEEIKNRLKPGNACYHSL